MSSEPSENPPHVAIQVFLDGLIAAVRSVFFYVLVGNYIGIGALAHEFGFSFWWMALSTLLIWAAPAQVILVSTLNTAALLEVALAVTLSQRALPADGGGAPADDARPGVRQRDLLLPMHLTAISVWVEGMRLLPLMPPRAAHRLLQRAGRRPDVGRDDRRRGRVSCWRRGCRRCWPRRCCSSRRWRS